MNERVKIFGFVCEKRNMCFTHGFVFFSLFLAVFYGLIFIVLFPRYAVEFLAGFWIKIQNIILVSLNVHVSAQSDVVERSGLKQ